jgi:TPP-dependent pyruvate/acetoin dehydrogenase alpha subunit
MRRASWVQALSGGAFAAVASILMFRLGDVEFSYVRCTIFLLAWGWPIVLVLHLFWGRKDGGSACCSLAMSCCWRASA